MRMDCMFYLKLIIPMLVLLAVVLGAPLTNNEAQKEHIDFSSRTNVPKPSMFSHAEYGLRERHMRNLQAQKRNMSRLEPQSSRIPVKPNFKQKTLISKKNEMVKMYNDLTVEYNNQIMGLKDMYTPTQPSLLHDAGKTATFDDFMHLLIVLNVVYDDLSLMCVKKFGSKTSGTKILVNTDPTKIFESIMFIRLKNGIIHNPENADNREKIVEILASLMGILHQMQVICTNKNTNRNLGLNIANSSLMREKRHIGYNVLAEDQIVRNENLIYSTANKTVIAKDFMNAIDGKTLADRSAAVSKGMEKDGRNDMNAIGSSKLVDNTQGGMVDGGNEDIKK